MWTSAHLDVNLRYDKRKSLKLQFICDYILKIIIYKFVIHIKKIKITLLEKLKKKLKKGENLTNNHRNYLKSLWGLVPQYSNWEKTELQQKSYTQSKKKVEKPKLSKPVLAATR